MITSHRRARRAARVLGAVGASASALVFSSVGAPAALAAPCPDVEVIFARGTTEAPGVGGIGQAFIDELRAQAGDRTVAVYPVNYPASTDFPRAAEGVADAAAHIRATAANCPDTKMVIGGYSQGAAVIGYVTADAVPAGYAPPAGITGPMPPEVADHVAAVTLFGKPSNAFLSAIDAPPIVIGARYAPKTIDLCVPGDPVCTPGGDNNVGHGMYAADGLTGQAADFAAHRL
jgi:cutinase